MLSLLKSKVCRKVLWILCLLCLISCPPLANPATAQDADKEDSTEIKIPVEMKPFTLTLVDEAGKPVKDAKVTAYGVRCEESPGSWIGWPTVNAGGNQFKSTELGKVDMKYPVKFGSPGLWMTLNKIDFMIEHPDFVTARVEFDPATATAEHTLVEGCRTLFSCVDENGKAIDKFGVMMAGAGHSAVWTHAEGELRSSGIPNGSWQTMLVAPRDDGVHLFSGVLPARYAKGKDVTIRKIQLRPGMQLSGSLADNVPHPVANGKVVAWCLPKPAGEAWGGDNPSIGWWEETVVAEDGTFQFSSLPRGGTVQLIAICKGWLTTGVERGITVGELIEVSDEDLVDNHLAGVTLAMGATGSVEVEVLGPDGKPLSGATVSTWPNQKLHLSGTTVVGDAYQSIEAIRAQITGIDQRLNMRDRVSSRYEGKTDEHGKVTLTDIPLNQNESLFASFDELRMKHEENKPKDIFSDAVTYTCASTEPIKVTIRMEAATE